MKLASTVSLVEVSPLKLFLQLIIFAAFCGELVPVPQTWLTQPIQSTRKVIVNIPICPIFIWFCLRHVVFGNFLCLHLKM